MSKVLLARGEKTGAKTRYCAQRIGAHELRSADYNAAALCSRATGVAAGDAHTSCAPTGCARMGRPAMFSAGRSSTSRSRRQTSSELAVVDADRGDDASALEWLDRALAKAGRRRSLAVPQAMLLESAARASEAETVLRQATQRCRRVSCALPARMSLARAGRTAEALPLLERAPRSPPRQHATSPRAADALADCARRTADPETLRVARPPGARWDEKKAALHAKSSPNFPCRVPATSTSSSGVALGCPQ